MRARSAETASRWSWVLDVAIVGAAAVFYCLYSAAGFSGSDDAAYIADARTWVPGIPPVTHFFGGLRYPVILPAAASIVLFGDNEVSVALPTFIYAVGTIVATYLGMRALTDRPTALLAALLFIALALMPQLSLTVGDDVPELFFVTVALLTSLWGIQCERGWPVFLVSGLIAGLAFMTRESAVALIVFYGLLFLVNYGGRRWVFWMIATGFATVYLAETVYYIIRTGDPLFRIGLVLRAAGTPAPNQAVGSVDLGSGRVFNIGLVVDAVLFALLHPLFGLMFPACIAAAIWAWLRRPGDRGAAGQCALLCRALCVFALLCFLVSAYVLGHLELIPRYFLVPLLAATMAVAIWLRNGLWPRHGSSFTAVLALLLLVDVGAAAITNTNSLFAERALASLAAGSSTPIHTDPETAFRGKMLYQWAGVVGLISSAVPTSYDLFLFNPRFAGVETARTRGFDLAALRPRSDWVAERQISEPPRVIALLLQVTRLDRVLPARLTQRISAPNPTVTLYRVP